MTSRNVIDFLAHPQHSRPVCAYPECGGECKECQPTRDARCFYADKPGGACWRRGKGVELCSCHEFGPAHEGAKEYDSWVPAGVQGTPKDQQEKPR
jgi:hypothetical protein